MNEHLRCGLDNFKSKTSQSPDVLQKLLSELNFNLGMIIGLKVTYIFSEHYTTGKFSNVSSSIWHITHVRHASIFIRSSTLTLMVVECTARWPCVIGTGIQIINFLPERRLCQPYMHPTWLTWPIIQTIGMPHCCISQLVTLRRYPLETYKVGQESSCADTVSPEGCQNHWWSIAFRG
jgi:hypothetical protein